MAKNKISQHFFSIFPTTRFSGKNKYIFYINIYIIEYRNIYMYGFDVYFVLF